MNNNNTIPLFKVFMSPTAKDEVCKVLDSGFIGQGPKVEEFEASLKSFFRNDKLVTLNSGTSGLHLAIHLLKNPYEYHTLEEYGTTTEKWPGIQDGDEILEPVKYRWTHGATDLHLGDGLLIYSFIQFIRAKV